MSRGAVMTFSGPPKLDPDDKLRLNSKCAHTLIDAKGWELRISLDDLVDFFLLEIANRVRVRLRGNEREVLLGAFIDFVADEAKAALLKEGMVSQADLEARQERIREVARRGCGKDNLRVVQ